MKIKTAFILCAGYGKRLNPITLDTPKPLIEIGNKTLLENTINLIKKLNIKKIKLNTFYLKDQISSFIKTKNFGIEIEIIEDGKKILDTGGGIYNMILASPESEKNFLVLNPDTIWEHSYVGTINKMIKFYFLNPNNNTLLVVDKKLSFDQNLRGDFNFYDDVSNNYNHQKNKLVKNVKNKYIYTGCQIINRKIFSRSHYNKISSNFSIMSIWKTEIKFKNLFGFKSKNSFKHITDFRIYKKLLKSY